MDLVSDPDKGLVSWSEITNNMLEVMPSLEGKTFELSAQSDATLHRMELQENAEVQELKKEMSKQQFRLARMERTLEAIALHLNVDTELPHDFGGDAEESYSRVKCGE